MRFEIDLKFLRKELSNPSIKKVCLQFPDGLKPKSKEIVDQLKEEFQDIEFYLWFGSNYGGCDLPIYLDNLGFDLLINFGHAEFKF